MGKTLYKIIVIASLIGLFVSSYLTYSYYAEKSVVCINKEHVNICDDVLNSSYSKLFFNIPNSLIGIFGFLLLLKLSYYGINGKDVKRLILFFSSVALLFVLYLAYLIFFVIKSACIWCFTSCSMIIIIFVCCLLIKKE